MGSGHVVSKYQIVKEKEMRDNEIILRIVDTRGAKFIPGIFVGLLITTPTLVKLTMLVGKQQEEIEELKAELEAKKGPELERVK